MISMCDSSETLCFLDVTGFETKCWVILVPKSAPGGPRGGPGGAQAEGSMVGTKSSMVGRGPGASRGAPGSIFGGFWGSKFDAISCFFAK